MVIGWC